MTTTRLSIIAAQLRPGDVIVSTRGVRFAAAFDVKVTADDVEVWTAVRDRERGVADVVRYDLDEPVTVDRRDGGPVVTVTEAGNIADADDAATMETAPVVHAVDTACDLVAGDVVLTDPEESEDVTCPRCKRSETTPAVRLAPMPAGTPDAVRAAVIAGGHSTRLVDVLGATNEHGAVVIRVHDERGTRWEEIGRTAEAVRRTLTAAGYIVGQPFPGRLVARPSTFAALRVPALAGH